MGVRDAMKKLQTGQRVRVDVNRGIVKVIQADKNRSGSKLGGSYNPTVTIPEHHPS